MRVAGVDEAGRGPVLGPMVLGVVVSDESRLELFRDLGVRDSKALTRKARERIFERLSSQFEIGTETVTATQINHRDSNLNHLEFDALCLLIKKFKPDRLLVDAFQHPEKLTRQLIKLFPKLAVVAEWKADVHHPIVSAASIVAKVTRDRAVDRLKENHGDIGSGYPSDPKTTRWLRGQLLKNKLAIHGLPACVRVKWSTLERLQRPPSCDPPEDEV